MANLSTIKRLAGEMDALEARFKPARPWRSVAITRAAFSDPEAVERRHYEMFPDDEDPNVVLVNVFHEIDIGLGPDLKKDAAWKALAREEMAQLSAADLNRLWGLRTIAHELAGIRSGGQHFAAEGVGSVVTRYSFPESEALKLMREAGLQVDDDRVSRAFDHGKTVGHKIGAVICLKPLR